jgi:hypothetical protein
MLDVFRIVRFSIQDFWDEFVMLVLFNLLWSLAVFLPSLPVLLLGTLNPTSVGLAALLALPLPVVSGALCYVTNQVSRGRIPDLGTLAIGLRRYWRKSLLVAGINVLALVAVLFTLYVVAWLVASVYWLLTQIYWFPMILELESESVWIGLRHSLALVLVSPGFTLLLGLILVVLGVVLVVTTLPAVVVLASFFLLIANHATRNRLAQIQKKSYRRGPP